MAVKKHQLACCALCQISAGNEDSMQSIQAELNKLQVEAQNVWTRKNRASGERAAFVIVAPGEDNLEKNLIDLGFQETAVFNRRNGYTPGILKMYFLNW